MTDITGVHQTGRDLQLPRAGKVKGRGAPSAVPTVSTRPVKRPPMPTAGSGGADGAAGGVNQSVQQSVEQRTGTLDVHRSGIPADRGVARPVTPMRTVNPGADTAAASRIAQQRRLDAMRAEVVTGAGGGPAASKPQAAPPPPAAASPGKSGAGASTGTPSKAPPAPAPQTSSTRGAAGSAVPSESSQISKMMGDRIREIVRGAIANGGGVATDAIQSLVADAQGAIRGLVARRIAGAGSAPRQVIQPAPSRSDPAAPSASGPGIRQNDDPGGKGPDTAPAPSGTAGAKDIASTEGLSRSAKHVLDLAYEGGLRLTSAVRDGDPWHGAGTSVDVDDPDVVDAVGVESPRMRAFADRMVELGRSGATGPDGKPLVAYVVYAGMRAGVSTGWRWEPVSSPTDISKGHWDHVHVSTDNEH